MVGGCGLLQSESRLTALSGLCARPLNPFSP